jgi:uncharacterized protein YigA (DUF484 family)
MIRFGGENDLIGEKLHRTTLALFAAPDLETTLAVLYHSLKEDFAVPYVASRLWGRVPEQSYLPELAATSRELREYTDRLGTPYGPTRPSKRATGSIPTSLAPRTHSAAANGADVRPVGSRARRRACSIPAWALCT